MAGIARGLRAYPALLRIGFSEAVAYRAELFVWMLTTTMPLVSMALWSAVAQGQRIGPEQFSSADFVAYFLLALIVRMLTGSWVLWQMNQEIRDGTLSQRLLRPVHPLLAYSAENLAALPLRGALVLPVALVVLGVRGGSQITGDPFLIVCSFLALPGAWAISFLSMTLVGALAFFIDSSLALFQVWMGSYMILSGYMLPLALLPHWLRRASEVLPFRYMLDFPVKLMMGLPGPGAATAHVAAVQGLAMEYGYVVVLLLLTGVLWRVGLRHFEAYGA